MTSNSFADIPLGKPTEYISQYAPDLLKPVPRNLSRKQIGLLDDDLPFTGKDFWTAYELSWLNEKGKPQVAIMSCEVPINSPNLIESKSFKLYLNSFNQTRLSNITTLESMLRKDLSECAGASVLVSLHGVDNERFAITLLPGHNIDDLDIDIDNYDIDATSLKVELEDVQETLNSHLLKSNCLITSQPDWASIAIRYEGRKIDHKGLLRYLISFRQHNEFHEQCVERIYSDIMTYCCPRKLTVYARYTRRGGLDINPFRSNYETFWGNIRLSRQ
jgi:7-cyano-7-deazaguanine reductase